MPRSKARAQGEIVNLTDRRAETSRAGQLDLLCDLGPDRIAKRIRQAGRTDGRTAPAQPMLPHLVMPAHHDVREEDVVMRRLHGNLAAAAERGPADIAELLLVPGVGARTVGRWPWSPRSSTARPAASPIPARFSLAHGGKDRHPVPRADQGL